MRDIIYNTVGFIGNKIAPKFRQRFKSVEHGALDITILSEKDQKAIKDGIETTCPAECKGSTSESLFEGRDKLTASTLPDHFLLIKKPALITIEKDGTYLIAFSITTHSCKINDKTKFSEEIKNCKSSDLLTQHVFFEKLNENKTIDIDINRTFYTKKAKISPYSRKYDKFELYVGCAAIALVTAIGVGVALYMKPDLLKNILNMNAVSSVLKI